MKVTATLALVFCFTGLISALDDRVSEDCLNGIADRDKCCEGVPDAWYAHLRNPVDCESFYQCEHEQATWKPCPGGLEWSVVADECQWPVTAQCKTDPITKPTEQPTTELPTTLPPTTQRPTTEAPTTQPPTTQPPTTQPPTTQPPTTQPPTTQPPTTQPPTTQPPTTQPPTTQPPTTQQPTTQPPTTQPPTTQEPSTATPPTTTAPPSEDDQCAPEAVCHQCITGEFPAVLCCRDVETYHKLSLANAEDCSSYYTCVNDKAILRQCPAGLHWSIDSDRCEWPKVAKCEANNSIREDGMAFY